jgi:BolA protein
MTEPSRAARIETALRARFAPTEIAVVDDSFRHAGHRGAAPGGETHFNILLVSAAFAGLNRVARARAVHDVLNLELQGGLHALSLVLRTPDETAAAR